MMVQIASPAVEFPPASAEDWRALVLKTLGDKPPESLTTTTADGLTIAPLYGPGASGVVPTRPFNPDRAWDLRGVTRHPDPARANTDILADLEGGAASVLVAIDPSAQSGVAVGGGDDLARVLDGVILELAPVALDAGFLGTQAADWLSGVAKASPTALLQF
ncbi:MAG: methylmalonyl-CoA mutase, partial [Caulobacterales bacterium 32-67-6]